MRLSESQIDDYNDKGLLLLPNCFNADEVQALRAQLPAIFAEPGPHRILEKDGRAVRSVYGSHRTNGVFRRFARDARLVEPAKQILDGDVYIYQFKINVKAAFGGDVWQWHQDYIFWRNEDGMPEDRVTNAAVFLDDVTEFNAPMFMIPGSHKEGVIEARPREMAVAVGGSRQVQTPAWVSNLTADLKYSIDKETVARLMGGCGTVAPKGPAGSMLLFHSNVVHSSPNNLSPFDRTIAFVTFNSVDNLPASVANPRPQFLAARDNSPVTSLCGPFGQACG
jgi:ectoine hydroxylase